jgi:hypothetical protein
MLKFLKSLFTRRVKKTTNGTGGCCGKHSCKSDIIPLDIIVPDEEIWKRRTTMDFQHLMEDQWRVRAYHLAEKDGFSKDAGEYWREAQNGKAS